MSITLNGLTEWIYHLRAMRLAGKADTATTPNAGDDVTRLRDGYRDERRLLRDGHANTRLSTAHDQRDELRNRMTNL